MAQCIVCKGEYIPGIRCPRCGADNRPWEEWQTTRRGCAGWIGFMQPGFYLPVWLTALTCIGGVVGVLALWREKLVVWIWLATAVGAGACIVVMGSVYRNRNHLRERELLNQVKRGPGRVFGARLTILAISVFMATAILAWALIVASEPATAPAEEPLSEHLSSYSSFIATISHLLLLLFLMPALVYISSLSLALSYVDRMNEHVPLPIFLNTARLARLVRTEAAQDCSSLGPGLVWEGMERTDDGGIKLAARYQHDRKIVENLAGEKSDVPVHMECEVLADPWGRIRNIALKPELQV